MSLHNTIIQAILQLSSMICDVRFLTLLCNKIKRLLRAIYIPGGDISQKKSSECTIRNGNICENVSIDTA